MSIIESEISPRRPELSADKLALLKQRLHGAGKPDAAAHAITRRAPGAQVSLSFAQQRLWFLDQLDPGSPAYNMPAAVRLHGALNLKALQGALDAIVARHEVLRTNFTAVDGSPVQVIKDTASVELPVIDLAKWPESDRESQARQMIDEDIRRPFDLATDSMLRARVYKLEDTDHILVITAHHIASDAWSFGVFFSELETLYQAALANLPSPLPELKVQYGDFSVWQHERLQKTRLETELSYWKNQLANSPKVIELPSDHPAPAKPSGRGAVELAVFPPELVEALKARGREEGATLFMVLLTAFNVLLYRYTRQTDILVGSPIAGRIHRDLEGLIGFFINTVILRTDLSGEPTFRELLQRVRPMTLDAQTHQELPLEKLIEALKLERNSTHSPLIRAMFVLQSVPAQGLRLAGLTATPVPVHNGTAKFDLTLLMDDTPRGLVAELEYSCDLFEAATIRRMLGHFRVLLEAVAQQPNAKIHELPLLTPEERREVLTDWSCHRTDYPRTKTIPELFEAQAGQTPAAKALTFQDQTLSYRELNERANQVAHHLRKLGVGPDTVVGISMERSVELIVGLVGILKAGGAYASLDPTYPAERLALMLDDLRPPVVLTQQRWRDTLATGPGMAAMNGAAPALLCLDTAFPSSEPIDNPPPLAGPENLAYVSFTSGSTGRPKGVCIPHRGVVRLVRNTNFAEFTADDVFLQLAPVAFDASTLEIWGALLNGAQLVVYPPARPDLGELGEFIDRQGITTLWLTAGLFNQMIEQQLDRLRKLKWLLAGGDVLSVPQVSQALEALPNCRLVNGYGPTENTTFTCCHRIGLPLAGQHSIPIGRPVANTEVYVLDDHLQPLPVGIPGELLTGGDGLATGYLKRPELTAEKFIPHPFAATDRARLYRTGDLVRWLPGGVIEFLGRMDQQVKIRGFRVELGEIETVLQQHPAVRECAVTVHAHAGEKRLAAFVVPASSPAPTVSVLRDFLAQKLPEYMVPSAFVFLASLPLTSNGKLDRRALPEPEQLRPELEKKYVAPRNEMEQRMATLWESVLDVRPVGVTDSFFDLGGHSLMAVRLASQVEKLFGKKVPVALVFQRLTVEQLVQTLEEPAKPESSIVAIQSHGSRPPLFLVHGVGGGMFWGYTNLSRYLDPDQPVYAFNSRGLRGLPEFESIGEIAAGYLADLRAFQPVGPYYLGGYCFGGNVAYEMARQLKAQGEPVALLALINCTPPNSSYNQVRWTPLFCLKFLKNLRNWMHDFGRLKPQQRRDVIHWKLAGLRRKVARLLRFAPPRPGDVDVEEVVDLSAQPEDRQALWKVHVQALMAHHVQPYPGRITLFRTPGHQFICSYDEHYGWGDLATEGVAVRIVPGSHESILDEPSVQQTAREMQRCLSEIQNQSSKVSDL